MYRLPISGRSLELRAVTGQEELQLSEAAGDARETALAFLTMLGDGESFGDLTVHDFECLLLQLRRANFGDLVLTEAPCACGERVDISFRLSDLEAARQPHRSRYLQPADEAGWFAIDHIPAFRLPTIDDQLAVRMARDPVAALAARCLRPGASTARSQRAMEALAPGISGPVTGVCPNCSRTLDLLFDMPTYLVAELRARAQKVYEEAHVIARSYHWSEDAILALPSERRRRYVAAILAESGGS